MSLEKCLLSSRTFMDYYPLGYSAYVQKYVLGNFINTS